MSDAEATLLLQGRDRSLRGNITKVAKHFLYLEFAHGERPEQPSEFSTAQIQVGDSAIPLGRARYFPHTAHPLRRADDPKELPGDGVLTTLDEVYDFDKLLKKR